MVGLLGSTKKLFGWASQPSVIGLLSSPGMLCGGLLCSPRSFFVGLLGSPWKVARWGCLAPPERLCGVAPLLYSEGCVVGLLGSSWKVVWWGSSAPPVKVFSGAPQLLL